jgi:hypothetical protein
MCIFDWHLGLLMPKGTNDCEVTIKSYRSTILKTNHGNLDYWNVLKFVVYYFYIQFEFTIPLFFCNLMMIDLPLNDCKIVGTL